MSEDVTTVEKKIVHLMLHHRSSVRAFLGSTTKPDQFPQVTKVLIDAILEAESTDASLTRYALKGFLDKLHFTPKEGVAVLALFNECREAITGVKPDDMPALLSRKKVAYVESKTHEYLQQFQKDLALDPLYAAKELTSKLGSVIVDAETEDDKVAFNDITSDGFYDQWEADLLSKKEKDKPVLDCGIAEFDEVMGTGFEAETLTVFVGNAGGYKTTTMMNVALNVWQRHGVDVLFVGLEMPSNRLMDKVMSRECRIPFEVFQKPKFTLTDEHLAKVREVRAKLKDGVDGRGGGRFALLEFPSRTTVSQIRRQIEKRIQFFKPRLVVIDYVANLEADKSRDGRNDLEIGDMLKSMLKMGKPGVVTPLGFGVVTGGQLTRDAIKRIKLHKGDFATFQFETDDVGGSHQYSADATSIIVMLKDRENPKRVFAFPVKNRYGKTVYRDGSNRGVLEVQPEIGLVSSTTDATWKSAEDDDLLKKIVLAPKIIPANEDEFWDSGAPAVIGAPTPALVGAGASSDDYFNDSL